MGRGQGRTWVHLEKRSLNGSSGSTVYTCIQVKKFGTVLLPQNRGVDLHAGHSMSACHEFFIVQMMSGELGTEGRFTRRVAIGPRGSLTRQVGLRNCSKMKGRAGDEYSVFRAALSPADHRHGCGWHITDIASGVR